MAFRETSRSLQPSWFNAPVPTFGGPQVPLLIVGLAPGLRGANRTGRPFTADFAGDLLYATLADFGWTNGRYDGRADDGLVLQGCAITNAVRCVPPQNKPLPLEIATCRRFLAATLDEMADLRAVLALGRIAHESVVRVFGVKLSAAPFVHGRRHDLVRGDKIVALFDSYHCSRYNTNTRVLTESAFRAVFTDIRRYIDGVRS